MAKPSVQSVKAELDTLSALSQERFIELLNRVKRLETVVTLTQKSSFAILFAIVIV